jgi:hypothetical protein
MTLATALEQQAIHFEQQNKAEQEARIHLQSTQDT